MRATAVSAFASVIGFVSLLAASPAAALSSIDLEWRGTGGLTTITVFGNTPQTLVADVILRVDPLGNAVDGLTVSFVVDQDAFSTFGPELTYVSAQENNPAGPFVPLDPGVTYTNFGGPALIELFDQASLSSNAPPGSTVTLGSITFQTNPNNLYNFDAPDLIVAVLSDFDGIVDSSGTRCKDILPRNDCPYTFGALYVNAPEPTTSALLVAGLGIGLFYSRRR